MSFYGLRDEHEIRLMYEHLAALKNYLITPTCPRILETTLLL